MQSTSTAIDFDSRGEPRAETNLDDRVKNAMEEVMRWCVDVGGVRHHHIYLWELSREHNGIPKLPAATKELIEQALAAKGIPRPARYY